MKHTIIFLILLASFMMVTIARADENITMTLYFCGSTMNKKMWDEDESPFDPPETIETLYHQQIANLYPFKDIIKGADGIVDKDHWEDSFEVAYKKLLPMIAYSIVKQQPFTLNLVGFSRGAVSTMYMAHIIMDKDDEYYLGDVIKKINILAFDPVPGYIYLNSKYFNLPDNVSFLGFYARDERSSLFAPVLPSPPKDNDDNSDIKMFTVPGSHETMVGNFRENGHGENIFDIGNDYLKDLTHLPRILKIVATEIMGSSEWGHVRFEKDTANYRNLDWYDWDGWWGDDDNNNIDTLQEKFEGELEAIYDYDGYSKMRKHSFVLGSGFESYSSNKCWFRVTPLINVTNRPRCIYFYGKSKYTSGKKIADYEHSIKDSASPAVKLNTKSDTENYDIWQLILTKGTLDVDYDLVDYKEDNCAYVSNGPALGTCTDDISIDDCTKNADCGEGDVCSMNQENLDNDDSGDVCDTCTDTDGDEFGNPGFAANECPLDNCPDSDLGETIMISGCDSGVENWLFDGVSDGGCTVSDKINICKEENTRNHGKFVRCVAHLTNSWIKEGLITDEEKDAIQSCAGQSN